ncbi:MAG: leucine-rich repeat domain-containing protein [Clostridia bacterium]|nr:leucine-rich repeat domain-containing protein [Clostridia bacterium]
MKNKKIITLLSLACLLTNSFTFISCSNGKNEIEYKNAYELYCEAYPDYTGTLEEWLDSLKSNIDNNDEQSTETLQYQKIAGKDEYRVIGLGTVSSLDIVIPATYNEFPVTEIGTQAFGGEGGRYLTSVTIPDSITSIDDSAFIGCNSLTTISIPNSVVHIGNNAFDGCYSLQYNEENGLKYLGNSENKYLFLVGTTSTDITTTTINENCKFIGSSAFFYCPNLTEITLPESITSIGGYVFANCFGLTQITIPKNVVSIGRSAFFQCDNLSSVIFTNPNNWQYTLNPTISQFPISNTELSDPSTAATYLTTDYCNFDWIRT